MKEPGAKAVKEWHEQIAEYVRQYGPVVRGQGEVQHHHVKGRKAVHRKVHIGQWFVIPLPYEFHDVHSNSDLNVTHHKKKFVATYGKQSELWLEMVERMRRDGMKIPFGHDVINAIMDTGA